MHLVYFDESKPDKGLKKFIFGAVCISDERLEEVENQVSEIAIEALGGPVMRKENELHAADIYHRKANFKKFPDPIIRERVLIDIAKLLSQSHIRLIKIVVNVENLREDEDASELAFMFLCERVSELMKSLKSTALLIGDRENDRESQRFAYDLSGHRIHGTTLQFGRSIDHIADSAHFTHSHLSRFLQLADCYTWLVQFLYRNDANNEERHTSLLRALRADEIDLFPAKYKEWPSSAR